MVRPERIKIRTPSKLMGDEPWRMKAACRGMQHLYYTPHVNCRCFRCPTRITLSEAREREEKAKEICNSCSVKNECLEFALVNKEMEDVWGGNTPAERKRMLASRLIQ